eukprot:CAMPEP_0175993700 /NCGR_PEP_ID=MMETSP0108-20121206/54122_1 /TAXON_ID=195067 ORGANISM="Goniomonas pacifica, Strain CCMP1869" /NCGR_SAMPLE_ID=MMETSP0108 /ASSEMBLY_ACC=CAM_ASM_000204 /LENGTH=51 /DNA_ID=CAMNT_0017325541 /DNA_START=1 /DNA_END=153 /DNA_ORIENTATION=+
MCSGLAINQKSGTARHSSLADGANSTHLASPSSTVVATTGWNRALAQHQFA